MQRAIEHLGVGAEITADPARVRAAAHVVFPGQGHFGQAMAQLRATGLDRALRDVIEAGTPFTGICLGLQLLLASSDEAPGVAGLGVFAGGNVAFAPPRKVPQIGWNDVRLVGAGGALAAVGDAVHYYFVHSFHAQPSDRTLVVGEADYDGAFVAALQRDNVLAVQFHPEKSGRAGLALLRARLEGRC